MNVEEFRDFCLSLPDVTEATPFEKFSKVMTPPKHVNFRAKKLFGAVGNIIDGAVAYIDLNGGGPTEMGRPFAQNGNFLTPEAKKFTGPEQYPWLVCKAVSTGFTQKNRWCSWIIG